MQTVSINMTDDVFRLHRSVKASDGLSSPCLVQEDAGQSREPRRSHCASEGCQRVPAGCWTVWAPMDDLSKAVGLAKTGRYREAADLFESLLADDPCNAVVLYNLGMCFTDLGEPEKAVAALTQSLKYAPDEPNTLTALGVAYGALGRLDEAVQVLQKALTIEPDNPYALKNLGGVRGRMGQVEESLTLLARANSILPGDAATLFGLGLAHHQKGELNTADRFYQEVLALDSAEAVKEAARGGRRDIAAANLKAKGLRMDAVMYMVSAMNLFGDASPDKVREVGFEIAMKGRQGLDINDPDRKYSLHSLPGEFTGLQLVSYMYVAFKQIEPELDVGVDLSEEFKAAQQIAGLQRHGEDHS